MELAVSLRACCRMSSCCRRVASRSLPSCFFTSRRRCTRLRITCGARRHLSVERWRCPVPWTCSLNVCESTAQQQRRLPRASGV
jgi:hypothetical protein